MFYCPLHNWYSDEAPCPACHKTYTTITTTTSGKPENEQWIKFPKAAFEKELCQSFNDAIDHAIELVKQHHVPFTERDVQLIFKLQALKK